jgi:putative transcriptional regulator
LAKRSVYKSARKELYSGKIMEGLQDVQSYEAGKKKLRARKVIVAPIELMTPKEVVRLRESLMLSQSLFAKLIGVSKKTLDAWEYGKNEPNGSSLRILNLIKTDPDFIHKYHLLNAS